MFTSVTVLVAVLKWSEVVKCYAIANKNWFTYKSELLLILSIIYIEQYTCSVHAMVYIVYIYVFDCTMIQVQVHMV